MKNLFAYFLKIESFDDLLADMTIDTTIEGFIKRNLRSEDGWNAMVDNDNKTFIFFVDVDSRAEMSNMISAINKIPTEKPAVLEFCDITEDLIYSSKYDNYKISCKRTQKFIENNVDKNIILDKMLECGGFDNLLEVEKRILAT